MTDTAARPNVHERAKASLVILLVGAAGVLIRFHPVEIPVPYFTPPASDRLPASSSPAPADISTVTVRVTGEVEHPGEVKFLEGATLRGLLETVRPKKNAYVGPGDFTYVLRDGDEVHIPARLDRAAGPVHLTDDTLLRIRIRSRHTAPMVSAPPDARRRPININRATLEELQTLPRIGPETARRIIEMREKEGGIKRKEEILRLRGIGKKTYLWLEPLITVE